MIEAAEALLQRAASAWSKAQQLYEAPTRGGTPDALRLVEQVASRPDCHSGLVSLLSSPQRLIVAYALLTLARMASAALAGIPDELCDRRENITISCGSFRTGMDLGGLARQYRKRAQMQASQVFQGRKMPPPG